MKESMVTYLKWVFYWNRRYLILEDQYKQSIQEYNEKKDKIMKMMPSDEDYH